MRKITFGAAVSLDGFLAGPDEALDWLIWSEDVGAISGAYWGRVDTVLMGRKTWEAGLRQGAGAMPGKRTIVFSRTLAEAPDGVELVSEDPAGFVCRLKAEEGGEICLMGGGELGAALLEAGLVDEVGVNLHPVLLGGGVPLFPTTGRRLQLDLTEARPIAEGCVYLIYKVQS